MSKYQVGQKLYKAVMTDHDVILVQEYEVISAKKTYRLHPMLDNRTVLRDSDLDGLSLTDDDAVAYLTMTLECDVRRAQASLDAAIYHLNEVKKAPVKVVTLAELESKYKS